ncbi:MAG: lysylphosphatidylglycerol synthase domain-containing protein [Thermaerobacter sp.]|nr:lysylphosphatidylglycerol synthase domain-containing protein [Thermaerobacter sp.]
MKGGDRLKRRIWTWGIPIVFSLAGVYAVLKSLGSFATLSHVHPNWLFLAGVVLVYPVFAAMRGLRFRQLLQDDQSWAVTIGLGWLYSAACSVLPGGIGEVSMPLLYRNAPGGVAHATAAMAVARVQDLLSWLVILAVAGFAVSTLPVASYYLLGASLLVTAAGALLVFIPPLRRAFFRLLRPIPWPKLHAFLEQLDDRLQGMVYNLPSWGSTLLLRLLSILSYYFALRGFGAPVTFAETSVGGALAALLLVLPVQGVAGIGTVEVWWIMILRLFGTPWSVAAIGAIGVHVSLLVMSLVVGGLSFRTSPRLLSST